MERFELSGAHLRHVADHHELGIGHLAPYFGERLDEERQTFLLDYASDEKRATRPIAQWQAGRRKFCRDYTAM